MDKLFEHTSIPKAYFTLAMPVVLSMVVTLVYNMVDTFFVSQTQNPNLVAGVSQSAPIFTFLIAPGDIFGLGGSSVISRLFGEKQDQLGRNVSGYAFYGSILCGIIVTIIMLVFKTPILHLLGATSATWQYANEYYTVLVSGATFIVFGLAPTNILRTEGLALESMKASMIGTILNIILNPIFIFPLGLGAAGSATATVISQIISDGFLIYYTHTKSTRLTTSIKETKISRHLQWELFAIGIPASVTNIMSTFAIALTNHYLIPYGADSVAAMGIALKISTIINMVFVGFAFGAQPLIGYTYGAKDAKRFNQIMKFDLQVVCGFSIIMTVLMFILAPTLMKGFLHDPRVISEGAGMIRWLVLSSTFAGIMLVFTTMFQSMGKAFPAFLLSVSRQGLIFFIVIVITSQLFGYTGVIVAQPIVDVLTAGLGILLFLIYRPRFKSKTRRERNVD